MTAHDDNHPFQPVPADQATAKGGRLPIGWRDACGSLLVPLQVCRHETSYATWKCDHERHAYEKCQYDDYMSRMKALDAQARKALEDA